MYRKTGILLIVVVLFLALTAVPASAGTSLQGNRYCSTGQEVWIKSYTTYNAVHQRNWVKTLSAWWGDYGDWQSHYSDTNYQTATPWYVSTSGYLNTSSTYGYCRTIMG